MTFKKIVDYLHRRPLLTDLLCLSILLIPTIVALLNNQYFSMHDDQHVARLFLFDKAFKEGTVYPRWVDLLGFGYGYPLFNFYPPLIYFVAEAFHLLGFGFIWSIKMMVMAGFVVGAAGMYFYAKSVFNRYSGMLSAILYTYFTYHAVTVYVRGALAEFFALSLLPFVFLTLRNFAGKRTLKNAIWFGISLALLIITHPLIAFPAAIYIVAFSCYYLWQLTEQTRRDFVIKGAFAGFLGLGLSAFFWLPSIVEKKFTFVDDILTRELANYKIHFVCVQQLWYSAWGYGGSGPGCSDGMTFQLGKIHLAFLALSLLVFGLSYLRKRISTKRSKEIVFITAVLAFSIFMMVEYSRFVWDSLSFLWYLQFPWRFLTFVDVFISLLGGGVCYFISTFLIRDRLQERIALFALGMGIVLSVFTYGKYFMPREQRAVTDAQMTSREEISWRISKSSFEFVPKGIRTRKSELDTTVLAIDKDQIQSAPYKIISGRGLVDQNEMTTTVKSFIVKQDQPVVFQLNTYNFPGWEAYLTNSFLDSQPQQLAIDDANSLKLIRVTLPKGEYILTFVFKDTLIRAFANLLSFMAVATILIYRMRATKGIAPLYRTIKKKLQLD